MRADDDRLPFTDVRCRRLERMLVRVAGQRDHHRISGLDRLRATLGDTRGEGSLDRIGGHQRLCCGEFLGPLP